MEFIQKRQDQMVIAIPSKGRLKEVVLKFLEKKNLIVDFDRDPKRLQAKIRGRDDFKIVLLHGKDIPIFVERSVIDVGFTGLDLIVETRAKVKPFIKLGDGKVKLSILVPESSPVSHPFELRNKSISTSFPNLAEKYFDKLKIKVKIQAISGASEGLPYLGLADAIVDVVETGSAARANHLKIIDDTLFDSECVCVVNNYELQCNYKKVHEFLERIY